MTILSLGRYGDIISQLPVAYGSSQSGARDTFVVADQFSGLFDGVSYCDVKRYSGSNDGLAEAIFLASNLPDLRVAQVHRNPDQNRHEQSYALEGYRLGKFRDRWRKYPLVFDKRDASREAQLVEVVVNSDRIILVNCKGDSSPFAHGEHLINGLRYRFPSHQIVNLAQINAHRIFDLLGLMDMADCLVTIDTATLWLANGAKCPSVNLINNGWYGSPPPTTGVASMRYSDYQIDSLCDEVEKTLLPVEEVVGIVDRFGQEKRHKEALKSQKKAFQILLSAEGLPRTAQAIGDPRPLPMLKEMLNKAIRFSRGRDMIVWTNDDVKILDLGPVKNHVAKFGAVGIRRDPAHMGRELFAFRWDWLADRIFHFPDCAVAAPWFDLAVAAWIRKQFGWTTTFENLSQDFYPCEIPNNGIFIHPDHPSSWVGEKERYPAANWNRHQFNTILK